MLKPAGRWMRARDWGGAGSRVVAIVAALMLSALSARAQNPPAPFVGEIARRIEAAAAEPPMRMPTSVAVDGSGAIWVCDGSHDRVLVFGPDGALRRQISRAGQQPFKSPQGMHADGAGNVWIADTGGRRVVALNAAGELVREIRAPEDAGAHEADFTDAIASRDGSAVWIVDNDGQRLLRFDLGAESWLTVGARGEAPGQFQYPYQIAMGAGGELFVSDVVNARVQAFDGNGRYSGALGSFGVERGQLYRPKGLAVDAAGRVWVADSVVGVVQVFRAEGAGLDVLRDAAGSPLRFDAPTGLAFDASGNLYVVELAAHRVAVVRIAASDVPILPLPSPRPSVAGGSARACAVCHIEMTQPLSEGRSTSLMSPPSNPPDDPVVARDRTCLSCHDGSVVDSRHRVWEQHGHQTGITPPSTMTVPDNLPLIDGKIACRTCHSAHATGAPTADISKSVFLRVPNTASELCMSCHTDKTRGPTFGTHPTGGMPWAIPDALVAAGAKVGPNPRELTCQVCHTPHGAQYDHLLVLGTSTNQLCVTCHDQMRPGMFREGGEKEHPLSPKANAEQVAAVSQLGTKLSPDGNLICLSCHKLHHGKGERFLLADDLNNGQMCLHCHSQRSAMLGSPHDLRTNHPQERNRLGLTPEAGGPCSACHLFHRFARTAAPGPHDASGECLTCHSTGRCAERKGIGERPHPGERCIDCHNPHEMRFGSFLAAPSEQLCTTCHADQARVAGSPHDSTANATGWRDAPTTRTDTCLACHRPHGDSLRGYSRVLPAVAESSNDGACLACHGDARARGGGAHALAHPAESEKVPHDSPLPLVCADESFDARIGCRTCHDPHGGGAAKFVRNPGAAPGAPAPRDSAALCVTCHSDMASIAQSAHAPSRLLRAGQDADSCGPCHDIHGPSAALAEELLWPKRLLAERPADDARVRDAGMLSAFDAYCVSCHAAGGVAAAPVVATHPDLPLIGLAGFAVAGAGDAGDLPLFDEYGRRSATGRIACRTCHLPHGRDVDEHALAPRTDAERRALRTQLRPFVAPNACTACHGADGARRYLYFHDPVRRERSWAEGRE